MITESEILHCREEIATRVFSGRKRKKLQRKLELKRARQIREEMGLSTTIRVKAGSNRIS
jgi:hypothetical protein